MRLKRPESEPEERASLKNYQFAESFNFCSQGGTGGRVYLVTELQRNHLGSLAHDPVLTELKVRELIKADSISRVKGLY